MRTSLALVLSAGAIIGTALTPAAASAMTRDMATANGSATAGVQALPRTPARPDAGTQPAGSDPATTVTFTVTSGALTMTAPASADLGTAAPGGTASGLLGTVTITDARALLSAAWTCTALTSTFTTGTATGNQVIPVTAVSYAPGTVTPTGTITVTPTTITMSASAQTVVAGTAGSGNNGASWNPTISVAVPAQATGGLYTGTITQSVS